jgi:hypothetical protein
MGSERGKGRAKGEKGGGVEEGGGKLKWEEGG